MRPLSPSLLCILGGLLAAMPSTAHAADNESVVIPMIYDAEFGGYAQEGLVVIRPCHPPSRPYLGHDTDPVLHGFKNDEEVFSKQVRNPRLILVEDPTPDDPSRYLDQTSFTLTLPWTGEYEEVHFYADPEAPEPSVVIPLFDAIGVYQQAGGRDQEASCQTPAELQDDREAIDTESRIEQVRNDADIE